MEDLLGVVIFAIIAVGLKVAADQKKTTAKTKTTTSSGSSQRDRLIKMASLLEEDLGEVIKKASSVNTEDDLDEGEAGEEQVSMFDVPTVESPAVPSAEKKPASPTHHREMAPRVQARVAVSKHDHSNMYEGTMGDVSTEGTDTHDHGQRPAPLMPSQYSDRLINQTSEAEPQEVVEPALQMGWNQPDALVRAFVMQEVLTRPCDRKR